MQDEQSIKKGHELELVIESLAYGGQGVARIDNFVVLVNGAIPGQKVMARIIKKKKSYAEARVLHVLQESGLAVTPRCRHFGSCGGCRFQNLRYDEQIKAKGEQVKDLLQRLGGMTDFEMLPTLPSIDIFAYRNKMEFSFSRQRWLTPVEIASDKQFEQQTHYLGFHAKGFFDKVIDLQECHLVHPVAMEILTVVRAFARSSNLDVYSTRDHKGFWRFLIIRPSASTDDLMVNIVTSRHNADVMGELSKILVARFPQITSLINGVTSSKANVAFSEQEFLLFGKPYIIDKLGKYAFRISANSFFQTNTKQAERLYDIVKTYADLRENETLYDLYCGAGTISIYLSQAVHRVVGFESVESAVLDARENSVLNGINNCEFVLTDLKDGLDDPRHIISTFGRPDIMVLDPPRGGMHPKTVKAVLMLQPEKIVHVSCNPTTLARELAVLCEREYELVSVQPVDMFPHTAHVEVVALLVRKGRVA